MWMWPNCPPPLVPCMPVSCWCAACFCGAAGTVQVLPCSHTVCLPVCSMLACLQLAPVVPCMGLLLILGACSSNGAGVCLTWLMLSSDLVLVVLASWLAVAQVHLCYLGAVVGVGWSHLLHLLCLVVLCCPIFGTTWSTARHQVRPAVHVVQHTVFVSPAL